MNRTRSRPTPASARPARHMPKRSVSGIRSMATAGDDGSKANRNHELGVGGLSIVQAGGPQPQGRGHPYISYVTALQDQAAVACWPMILHIRHGPPCSDPGNIKKSAPSLGSLFPCLSRVLTSLRGEDRTGPAALCHRLCAPGPLVRGPQDVTGDSSAGSPSGAFSQSYQGRRGTRGWASRPL